MLKRRSVGLVVVGLAVLVGGAAQAQAQVMPSRAQRVVNTLGREASSIVSWAYPTVTFRGFDGCGWNGVANELTCRFRYLDMFGDAESRVLGFSLDDSGFVSGIKDVQGDSLIPPFTVLRGFSGVLAKAARADLDRTVGDNDEARRQLLLLLAQEPEPEQVLMFLLNIDIVLHS